MSTTDKILRSENIYRHIVSCHTEIGRKGIEISDNSRIQIMVECSKIGVEISFDANCIRIKSSSVQQNMKASFIVGYYASLPNKAQS